MTKGPPINDTVMSVTVKPAQVPDAIREGQRAASNKWRLRLKEALIRAGELLRRDGERVKEAKIRQEEFKAQSILADTQLKRAQALKALSEATEIFQRAEAARIANETNQSYLKNASVGKELVEVSHSAHEIEDATLEIVDALLAIRRRGGAAQMDFKEESIEHSSGGARTKDSQKGSISEILADMKIDIPAFLHKDK